MTLLAVPPLIPRIHRDLHLSEKAVGALTSLPVLLLAAGAIFGSLLVARVGARRTMIAGLTIVGLAGAARGLGTSTPVLFVTTFLMGLGVAISQPSLPSLARLWAPGRVALATALYSNGFLVGEVVAAAFTVPLVLPLGGGGWQGALGLWSVPVLVTALAFALFTRHAARHEAAAPLRWWPEWGGRNTWRLGLILGGASLAYFGTNAFIPDYLRAVHAGQYIAPALVSVNVAQLPASLLVAAFPQLLVARRWPIALAGGGTAVAVAGFALGGPWVVVWAAPLGFATASVLVLVLALAPLLAGQDDVHRLSAAIFTMSYACGFAGTFAGGAIWDATAVPLSSFLPVVVAGLTIVTLALQLDLSGARRGMPPAARSSGLD